MQYMLPLELQFTSYPSLHAGICSLTRGGCHLVWRLGRTTSSFADRSWC